MPRSTPPLLFHAALACLLLALPAAGHAAEATVHTRPDRANVRYGPHERNVLDLWMAKSAGPAPLFVYIHGGGWINGDKSTLLQSDLDFMLRHGVSVAAVNYRYSTLARLPAPVRDAARAIQFLRSKAGDWNLNPRRVAAAGGSAGACTSLWLAFHDDLADPASPDPVARQSTRLCAAVGLSAQTSIDPAVIVGWVGDQVMNHPMISRAVGARDRREAMARYAEFSGLYREFSPINHVSRDDPPVMVVYPTVGPLPAANQSLAIHHAAFGLKLKERADAAGAAVWVRITDRPDPAIPLPNDFLLKYLCANP